MSWEDVSYVLRGKTRKAILLHLETPKTPSLLALELHTSTPNVSRALKELLSRNLIESLTPHAKLGKLLVATKKGRLISSKVRAIKPGV